MTQRSFAEIVPAEVAELAGSEFMARLIAAASRIAPMPAAAAVALGDGPEIAGGIDVEPDDE